MSVSGSQQLTLMVSAPTAIEQFAAMTAGARGLTAALADLNRVGAGGAAGGTSAAGTRMQAELAEVRAALKANQMQTESLQRALDEQSKANVAGIARETAAIKEKNKVERDEAKKTAAVKKAADEEVTAKARLPALRANGLSFPGGTLTSRSDAQAALEVADVQRMLAARAAEVELRKAGVTQSRALNDHEAVLRREEADLRKQGVTQYRAITDNEALARKEQVHMRRLALAESQAHAMNEALDARSSANYIRELNKNDVRLRNEATQARRLGLAQSQATSMDEALSLRNDARVRAQAGMQYRAVTENEALIRRDGVMRVSAERMQEKLIREKDAMWVEAMNMNEAHTRARGVAMSLAATENEKRAAAAATAARRASAAAAAAANANPDPSGTGRSVMRGAAGAGGAMFLTYGQNIPALAATFAAGAAIKESIKDGASFQQEMAFVRVASEETAPAINKITQEIRAMAADSLYGPIEMAKGLRKLAEAGFDTKDAMTALVPVMNIATLGQTDVGQAAKIAQGLMHAFNLEAKDVGHIGDVMAKAANISATDILAMGEALKQSSTVAERFNVSIEDQASLLAVLAKRNITGSAAGTALTNMFTELNPHTVKAQRAFKQLGITVDDGTGSYKKMIPLVQEVAAKLRGMPDIERDNFLQDAFNNRGLKSIFSAVSDAQGDLPKFFDMLMHASDGAGYMARSIAIIGETAQSSFAKLKAAAEGALIGAFDSAETKKTLESLRKLVNDPEFQEGLKSLVGNFSKFVNLVGDNGGTITAAVGSYVLFAKVIPAIATGVVGLIAAVDGAVIGSALTATVGIATLAQRGGLLGVAFFGGWMIGDWLGHMGAVRGALADFFSWVDRSAPRDVMGTPTKALDDQISGLDARIAASKLPQETDILKRQRKEAGAARVDLYRRMGLDANGRPVASAVARPSIDPFEVDGRQSSGTDGPRPGSVRYDRLNPIEEATKKAKTSEAEALIKRGLADEEQAAKQSLAILDAKHKYGLMTEDVYISAVEDLEDKRAIKEQLRVDAAVIDIQAKIKTMKIEADQIRATTALLDLQSKAARLQSDAEFVAEQRRLKMVGERAVRERANKAAAAGYTANFAELVEQQNLAQTKAREAIEGAIRPGVEVAQTAARMGVEQVYLTASKALKKEIAELEEKGDKSALERVEKLRPLIGLLERQKAVQSDIAATEAASNYARQREFVYGWEQAYQQYVESSTNAAQQARDVFGAASKGMEDAIVTFTKTGKLSFRDFANTVIQELIRIEARKLATSALSGIGSIFGMIGGALGGGGGAAAGSAGAAAGGTFEAAGYFGSAHTGGVVGSLTGSRSVSNGVFAGAPRFHTGGLIGDEMPIIAKRGEGVFTREQMAALAPVGNGSGDVTIQIVINPQTGSSETTTKGADSSDNMKMLGDRMALVAREEISRQQRPGGLLASRGRG